MALWLFPSDHFTKEELPPRAKNCLLFPLWNQIILLHLDLLNAALTFVKQFWSLKTHTYSRQNVIAIEHKIILLLSGAFPEVLQAEDSVVVSCPLQKLQRQRCKEVSMAAHISEVVTLGILPRNYMWVNRAELLISFNQNGLCISPEKTWTSFTLRYYLRYLLWHSSFHGNTDASFSYEFPV